MSGQFTIVDGHVHTFSSDEVAEKIISSFNKIYEIEFINSGNGTIQNVLENMDAEHIDYTVMANFAPPKIIHNNNLWGLKVKEHNPRFIPLVSFHPEMEGTPEGYLEEYLLKGAGGIKIHPMAQGFRPDHERMTGVYRICSEQSVPVVFHTGRVSNARLNEYADLESILPVIDRYPEMPVVLTHMADGNIKKVLWLSKNYANVYFDTSIVVTGFTPIKKVNEPSWLDDDEVVDIFREAGMERIVFGSDYPWGNPGADIRRILNMKLTTEEKEQIIGQNALKLFKRK